MDPLQFQREVENARQQHGFVSFFSRHALFFLAIIVVIVCLGLVCYATMLQAPAHFPPHTIFTVKEGSSVTSVAQELKSAGYVPSSFAFKNLVIAFGREKGIIAGDYYFEQPEGVFRIVSRLTKGDQGLAPIKITIPEGLTVAEIAKLFEAEFDKFEAAEFKEKAREGFMFPDTYFVLPNATTDDVIEMMERNFNNQIADQKNSIELFQQTVASSTLDEIITMASILEGEARTTETRQIISGILWKRLEIGMPLQVDAAFRYINGKNTYELTQADLDIESPYNTYKYAGLPPTPISNPGLDSIRAAVMPSSTPYLYFLSSRNGTMYYAKDFEGHKRNRELYLNK